MHALRTPALIPTRFFTALVLCLALFAGGCSKKPVHATPAVLVPTIETQPQPEPPSPQPTVETTPEPEPAPAGISQRDVQKPKPKPRKPVPRKPVPPPQQAQQAPAPVEPPKPEPAKPEAVKPGTPDSSVQITADVPRAAVQSQKENTVNLLRDSEAKLAHINRNLGDSEQGMLRQARNYIAQSNQALRGGDIERAYNLAVKASLLANELSKQ